MKKLLLIALAVMLTFTFVACEGKTDVPPTFKVIYLNGDGTILDKELVEPNDKGEYEIGVIGDGLTATTTDKVNTEFAGWLGDYKGAKVTDTKVTIKGDVVFTPQFKAPAAGK